jgi:Diiron non-heme beta-hydroxylase N-terminal domain
MIAQDVAMSDLVYLKPEVKVEPLVCRWYAWSHLIAPVQLALHIKYRILPLLHNFVQNPLVHVAANRDPNMYGGPFVSLEVTDVERVVKLIDDTTVGCAGLIKLAEDLRKLDDELQKSAQGFSLHEFYDKLPESLRGFVEFVYDVHHRPSFRFFESMLYDSGMARPTQEVMLQLVGENDRHFFMSTPRLETPTSQFFKIKFADPRLDILSRPSRAFWKSTRGGWPRFAGSSANGHRANGRASGSRPMACACDSSGTPACCSKPRKSRSCSIRS